MQHLDCTHQAEDQVLKLCNERDLPLHPMLGKPLHYKHQVLGTAHLIACVELTVKVAGVIDAVDLAACGDLDVWVGQHEFTQQGVQSEPVGALQHMQRGTGCTAMVGS